MQHPQINLDSPPEPIDIVARRVRRRVITMLIALIAIPCIYIASTFAAHRKTLEIADCLPPGITLDTPVSPDASHPTVADALQEAHAVVQNGVLIDSGGRPIVFEQLGENSRTQPAPGASPSDRKSYRNITIQRD